MEKCFPQDKNIDFGKITFTDIQVRTKYSYEEVKSLRNWILDMQQEFCSSKSYVNSSSSNIIIADPQFGNIPMIFTWSSKTFDRAVTLAADDRAKNQIESNIKLFGMEKYVEVFQLSFGSFLETEYSKWPNSIILFDCVNGFSCDRELICQVIDDKKCPLLILIDKNDHPDMEKHKIIRCQQKVFSDESIRVYAIMKQISPNAKELDLGYPSVQSLRQLHSLFGSSEYTRNLNFFLKNKLGENNTKTLMVTIDDKLYDKWNDFQIYNFINDLIGKLKHNEKKDEEFHRASYRIEEVKNFLGSHRVIGSMSNLLDVGCAEGSITVELGNLFIKSPEKDKIFGCDVRKIMQDDSFHFSLLENNILPYPDSKFQFVTCFMTLHHIIDCQNTISEIFRVLEPGGYFLLREHSSSDGFGLYLDVIHAMYALVLSQPQEWPDFCSTYVAKYYTSNEWTKMIEKAGFREINRSHPKGNLRWYYGLYQKPPKRQLESD